MIHPGVRRRPLLLLPLFPSASADIAFDRKRAEINLLERGGGVRACVVRLCKLTERGLNTQVAREEERGMTFGTFRGWPFHAVCVLAVRDGEESPRPGRVPPRAMICCLEMCQYWICMPVYGGDFWELVSMFNTKVHALLFSVSRSLRSTGWGRYLQATDFLASALGSSFGREFLLRRGRVSWNDGIWFLTLFPSYFIRIVREKKKERRRIEVSRTRSHRRCIF